MAGGLTRDEARTRAALLTVDGYDVALDVTAGADADPGRFGSTTVARFRAEPGAATFIDLAGARLRSVTLNGSPVDTGDYDPALGRIALSNLAATNELRVEADCAYSRTGEGLHRFVDPLDGRVYLYSQFATADTQRAYACFDQPDLKAPFELTVHAPEDWSVASTTTPERHGGIWRFPATPPLPTYATAVVAGPYHIETGQYRGTDGTVIPLGVWCRASLAPYLDADVVMDITRRGFAFFTEAFRMAYPFGKYDQIFCPEFNLGAMENAGCVTINEKYVFRSRATAAVRERRAETLLHEMAHMWFGDLVTMRWWDDSWLNESFATWAGLFSLTQATSWTGGWTSFASMRKAQAYREDQLPSTHPVSADIPDIDAMELNFDSITYLKGASTLKALAAWVGRDAFLAGVSDYFRRHAWGNTTLTDLLDALIKSSGRDLTEWSRQWLQSPGVNTLRPVSTVDDGGRYTAFAVHQEGEPVRWHRIAVGLFDLTPAGLARRGRLELDVAGHTTDVPRLLGEPQADLVLLNDDDLTYTKLRFDDRSLATILSSVDHLIEPMPRALVWSTLWDMTRDGDLPAREFLRLVLAGIAKVTESTVAQTVLSQTQLALHRYTAPAHREPGLTALADGLEHLLRSAEPASDLQLLYAQAFARVARTPNHLALVRELLDGTAPLDGLTADPDLRWSLLRRLVARGAAGPADIDAELTRDPTADGERHAAGCRAAVPTARAKAAAWERITSGELSNFVLASTMDGFTERDHDDVLAPYAEHYFGVVADIWNRWSIGMARRFADAMYPAWAVSPETIERTDEYITTANPPGALRRILLEDRDDVRRALCARACDAAALPERR